MSKLFLLVLLALALPPTLAASDSDTIASLCAALDRATTCQSARIQIPAVRLTYIDIPWPKPNPCKSKLRYGFGWTCIPGTDEVRKRVPNGIEFYQQEKDLCGVIKKAVPNLDDIRRKSAGVCKCLPKIYPLLGLDAFKQVIASASISDASADVLKAFGEFAQCATDAGFNVADNRANLDKPGGALSSSSSTTRIFRAAEVDLARYLALAGALAPCATPAGCQPETIRGFFEKYLEDSEAAVVGDVKALLSPWSKAFDEIESGLSSLSATANDLGSSLAGVRTNVEKIANDICPDINQCVTSSLADLKREVVSTLDASRAVADAQQIITSAIADIKQIQTTLNEALAALDAVTSVSADALISKVLSGQFRDFADLASGLKAAQRLPNIINDLASKLPQAQKVAQTLVETGPKFASSLQNVLARNWLADFNGDAAAAHRIEQQVFALQEALAKLVPQATQVFASVSALVDIVGTAAVDPSALAGQVDFGVASYQRWTRGSFDIPCLTTGKWKVTILGFTGSINYPKASTMSTSRLGHQLTMQLLQFYRCRQKYRVPFPNQHIPYFRLRLPDNSPLVRIGNGGGNPAGSTTSITWKGVRPTVSGGSGQSSTILSTTPASSVASASSTIESATSSTESATSAQQAQTSSSPSAASSVEQVASTITSVSSITPAPARRRVLYGRQAPPDPDVEFDPASFAPPPDSETSVSAPGGVDTFTDAALATSSAIAAAASAAPASTVLFYETTFGGAVTTVPATQAPSGSPTATEVQPDPPAVTEGPSADLKLELFADVPSGTGTSVVSTWSEVGTANVDVSVPTATSSGSINAGGETTASASATGQVATSSSTPRAFFNLWLIICAACLSEWTVVVWL